MQNLQSQFSVTACASLHRLHFWSHFPKDLISHEGKHSNKYKLLKATVKGEEILQTAANISLILVQGAENTVLLSTSSSIITLVSKKPQSPQLSLAQQKQHDENHCRNCSAYLTGLLVRDTLKDSRQLRSFSSEIPDRSSWMYSCEDSVHSCLLFFSPPYHRRQNAAECSIDQVVFR